MENNTRYTYEIRPTRPINIGGKPIRQPSSMLLTKSEVVSYMKYGPVYRKYVEKNVPPVRVTLSNLNNLHHPYGWKPVAATVENVNKVATVIPPTVKNIKDIIISEKEHPQPINKFDFDEVDPDEVEETEKSISETLKAVQEKKKEEYTKPEFIEIPESEVINVPANETEKLIAESFEVLEQKKQEQLNTVKNMMDEDIKNSLEEELSGEDDSNEDNSSDDETDVKEEKKIPPYRYKKRHKR